MQCNFTFCLFVSSGLFFLEVVVKLFDYFWKPHKVFSKFCVKCLLMFYFVYCHDCALKDVNGTCWSSCSLVALWVPEMCFRPAKTRKNLELFEVHTCHWPCAQIWFRHKWRKLVTASLLLHCIGWYSCFRFWNEFFSAVFQVLYWSFLVLHFDGNVCIWFQKWFDHECIDFGVFCWKPSSFVDLPSVWTENCKNCSIVNRFRRHQFFRCFVWGVFWSVL